jgi:hypothetical protein
LVFANDSRYNSQANVDEGHPPPKNRFFAWLGRCSPYYVEFSNVWLFDLAPIRWLSSKLNGEPQMGWWDRKEVTGRDTYLIVEALTFAVEALSKLPVEFPPDSNIKDMKRLIDEARKQEATLSQAQKIAQRRLSILLAGRQERRD